MDNHEDESKKKPYKVSRRGLLDEFEDYVSKGRKEV